MTSVATVVREQLADARAHGAPFERAWPTAIETATATAGDPDEWRSALDATRPAWEAAWEGRPATRGERALQVVAADPERVKLTGAALEVDGRRRCRHCGEQISPARRRTACYCSPSCQRAAHGRRAP